MEIRQLRYASDNFSYLLMGTRQAMVIDGGAVDAVLDAVAESGVALTYVTNTHLHYDHVPGNQRLLDETDARFLDCRDFTRETVIHIDEHKIEILVTPGHTADSVCFSVDGVVITGDTLFNGTIGNCFTGDLTAYYHSLSQLMALPPETRVYAGHDYIREAIAFARSIEPNNPFYEPFMAAYDPEHVFSTMTDELKVNPYLRFNDPEMIALMDRRGLNTATALDRFNSIMELY